MLSCWRNESIPHIPRIDISHSFQPHINRNIRTMYINNPWLNVWYAYVLMTWEILLMSLVISKWKSEFNIYLLPTHIFIYLKKEAFTPSLPLACLSLLFSYLSILACVFTFCTSLSVRYGDLLIALHRRKTDGTFVIYIMTSNFQYCDHSICDITGNR